MRSSGEVVRELSNKDLACATRRDLMFDFKRLNPDQVATGIDDIKAAKEHLLLSEMYDWNYDSDGELYRRDGRPSTTVVFTRKKTDAEGPIKSAFDEMGGVKTYTGSTSSIDREATLNDFLYDRLRYLIATSAFGMGVNKRDVWLAGYLGQPFTLKGLYQAFGRAARDSAWSLVEDGTPVRSGLCIGRFYGRNQGFSPRMKIKLSMERMYDLLSPSFKDSNEYAGYLLLDLAENPSAGWTTNLDSKQNQKMSESKEDDSDQDEYDLLSGLRLTIDRANEVEMARLGRKSMTGGESIEASNPTSISDSGSCRVSRGREQSALSGCTPRFWESIMMEWQSIPEKSYQHPNHTMISSTFRTIFGNMRNPRGN